MTPTFRAMTEGAPEGEPNPIPDGESTIIGPIGDEYIQAASSPELFECSKCHIRKPADAFYTEKRRRYKSTETYMARRADCRECYNRDNNRSKVKAKDRRAEAKINGITISSGSGSSGNKATRAQDATKTHYHLDSLMIKKLRRWGDLLWSNSIKYPQDFNAVEHAWLRTFIPEEGIKIIRQALNNDDGAILDHVFRFDRSLLNAPKPLVPINKHLPIPPPNKTEEYKAADVPLDVIVIEPEASEPASSDPVSPPVIAEPMPLTLDLEVDIIALAELIVEHNKTVKVANDKILELTTALQEAQKDLQDAIAERRNAIGLMYNKYPR